MYFGREVGHGNRRVLCTYSLSKRVYLGPTSMDTEIAFIMCNQGKVLNHRIYRFTSAASHLPMPVRLIQDHICIYDMNWHRTFAASSLV